MRCVYWRSGLVLIPAEHLASQDADNLVTMTRNAVKNDAILGKLDTITLQDCFHCQYSVEITVEYVVLLLLYRKIISVSQEMIFWFVSIGCLRKT